MNPEQPAGGNPYDFITNPQAPKKSLVPNIGGSNPFIKKIILIVGGAVILIIGMWFVGNLLGGSDVNQEEVINLTQLEHEIARVADEGDEAADQTLKNVAKNTALTMRTQQKEWLTFLAERGTEVSDKDLALKQNAATDTTLESATASNTFDLEFRNVMETYLTSYLKQLETDFNKSSHEAQKALLQSHHAQTQLLLEQLPKE